MAASVSMYPSAFSRRDFVSPITSVTGYTSSWKSGSRAPRSRAIWQTTAVRLPPAESPPTASHDAGPPNAPSAMAFQAAKASSAAAGYRCSGASR